VVIGGNCYISDIRYEHDFIFFCCLRQHIPRSFLQGFSSRCIIQQGFSAEKIDVMLKLLGSIPDQDMVVISGGGESS